MRLALYQPDIAQNAGAMMRLAACLGVPDEVQEAADLRLRIPMRPGLRSLNVALAAAMVLGEALRQAGSWPAGESE